MGRDTSDEAYVLGLCDRILGVPGLRQHRFDWLLGDPGKNGRQVRLPVDAYWPDARLVVDTASCSTSAQHIISTSHTA
jgi:hypothetical protein